MDELDRQEVRRVSDALDALDAIPDRLARVKAKSQIMAAQIERNKAWSEERRQLVIELRESGMPFRKIAAEVGTSLPVVQDILRGHKGSGLQRPSAKKAEQPAIEEQT